MLGAKQSSWSEAGKSRWIPEKQHGGDSQHSATVLSPLLLQQEGGTRLSYIECWSACENGEQTASSVTVRIVVFIANKRWWKCFSCYFICCVLFPLTLHFHSHSKQLFSLNNNCSVHLAEELLAGVSEMGAEQLNSLRVDILSAGSVVLRLNVGHLVSEALAV
jgi:hypothetical protein